MELQELIKIKCNELSQLTNSESARRQSNAIKINYMKGNKFQCLNVTKRYTVGTVFNKYRIFNKKVIIKAK